MDGSETTSVLGQSFYSRALELSQMVNIVRSDNYSHCNSWRPKNSSIVVIIPGGYEGIPQNLTINFVAWIVRLNENLPPFTYTINISFFTLGSYNPLFSSKKECLELWKNGSTSEERKKVTKCCILYSIFSIYCF